MFDFNEIENFDEHIDMSIPNYSGLIEVVKSVAEYFLDPGRNVYDIGCSTGKFLKELKKVYGVNYYGIDNSNLCPPTTSEVTFIKDDIANVNLENACLITAIFSLQFTYREQRWSLIKKILNAMQSNSAFIVAEKTYCKSGRVQDIMNSAYYENKMKKFSGDEILKKERQLRQNLKYKEDWDFMKEVGTIGTIQEIWRSYNFVAYLCIKS